MSKQTEEPEIKNSLVIKFVGDSGDGMQLAGTLFSDTAAIMGNDLFTFPDYPAEIRAPRNTPAGVSGFQVQIGSQKIYCPGDLCDILICMNPASLRTNLKWTKEGGIIVLDKDAFTKKALAKSGYQYNPLESGDTNNYKLVSVPATSGTTECLETFNIPLKLAERSRNIFMLGIIARITSLSIDVIKRQIESKFSGAEEVINRNIIVLEAGYNFASFKTTDLPSYQVPGAKLKKGRYRNISGNIATAWGLLAASEKSDRPLFLGSYPITPATEILSEVARHKSLGAVVFQAEDEISGICSSIGAGFSGSLAVTTTSGPGLSLKSEAIGLAVMTELPLVIVNVQRAGPSTGMPTKSEQSDLLQALYGRNGECPAVVMCSSTPANCFYYAYEAAKISMEHMTPVILLSDGYIGNGSELFRIPAVSDLPGITPPLATENDNDYKPYRRNPVTLAREWAVPGMEGLRHRIGGLEKSDVFGEVTTDPENHQRMVQLREDKVRRVARSIPLLKIRGKNSGELLVVGWGGTEGSLMTAVKQLQKDGKSIGHAHFNHIMPMPVNSEEIFTSYKKIIVCELNGGQFVRYLRSEFPGQKFIQYNKVQGLPFFIEELTKKFNEILEEDKS